MFNTYQELVDRIEELLVERKKLNKRIRRIEKIYGKIPPFMIEHLYRGGYISKEEKIYWSIIQNKNRKEKLNERWNKIWFG